MATQPNAGRDIESDILRVLAEADAPMPSGHIGSALQPPLVRPADLIECMATMDRNGWLDRTFRVPGPFGKRAAWSLTDEGMRVAEARGLARRAEG